MKQVEFYYTIKGKIVETFEDNETIQPEEVILERFKNRVATVAGTINEDNITEFKGKIKVKDNINKGEE